MSGIALLIRAVFYCVMTKSDTEPGSSRVVA